MDGAAVSIRLRRSTPSHDAYTVRVYDRSFAALATARPADARRWVATTRWLHWSLHHRGRLVVGLGVQWTPTRLPLHGVPPVPSTLQICVGHRCLLFHLAHAGGAVPEILRRFLADPRVTFVGSGSDNDRRMLWAHYGLHVARGCELRAVAGMGNASLEDMADRFLGYPGIHKPRDVAMSAWHAPRLSSDQVQYACVDAYLAFHLGLVLCPAAAEPPRRPVLPRAPPPAYQRPPVLVRQAPPAQQRAPAAFRQAPPVQRRAPAHVRAAPSFQQRAPVVAPAAPRFEWSPRALSGRSAPAVVGVGAAITSSKLAGLTESDMYSENDYYDDDVGITATHGLPIRVHASDSDGIVDSSDGFEHVRLGAFTDDEEGEDDGYMSYSGTGSLGHENEEGCNGDDQEGEEGYDGDDLEDEEGYQEYTGTGILTDASNMDGYAEFVSKGMTTTNMEEEYGGGYQAFEYLGYNEVVPDNVEDALAQDDRYDQGVDYGCDQDDEDEFEEFYLL
ncbi:hypothetical protein SETIT_2G004100v2 [Setaria italica]|uniref:3'-5' exonuclease domain-containing protein n=1 Tax=Setaria italica TaxID=4555 RepID=A0A368PTS8_SETIT|nr:hypothetical protein SETIT_2G004100v2 [Setaria italica]